MREKESFAELREYIDSFKIINSHEHLPNEVDRIGMKVDFFTLWR